MRAEPHSGVCCERNPARHSWAWPPVVASVNSMSNFGFGFGPSSGDGDDLSAKIPLFAELQKLLSNSGGGPVNWDLARQLAISNLAPSHHLVG
jgi:hypothetical protein